MKVNLGEIFLEFGHSFISVYEHFRFIFAEMGFEHKVRKANSFFLSCSFFLESFMKV